MGRTRWKVGVGGVLVDWPNRVTLVPQFLLVVDGVWLWYGDWHYQGFLVGLPIGGSVGSLGG